jgi:hypothetical protein
LSERRPELLEAQPEGASTLGGRGRTAGDTHLAEDAQQLPLPRGATYLERRTFDPIAPICPTRKN